VSPDARISLVESILEAHGARDDGAWELHPDHVVLDEEAGAFATWVFADELRRPVAGVVGLVVADGRGPADTGLAGIGARVLEQRSRRVGFHFAPRGLGRCDHVYLDRLAGPGRLALTAGAGAAVAGAAGTLVLGVSALEAVAAAAGAPLPVVVPPVVVIELNGALGTGVSGHDLMVEIAHRGADRIPRGAILEFAGPGLTRLSMRDRMTAAMSIEPVGASAVLLPVDEPVRPWYVAHGREADWKRFGEGVATPDAAVSLQLESIEPWCYRSGEPSERRRVRHAAGSRVEAVVIGPGASESDLEWMLACLADKTIAPETRCFLVPGSRRLLDLARRDPARRILRSAGVRLSASPALPGARGGPRGRILYFGVPAGDRLPHGDAASLQTCIASACSGHLLDPRELAPVEVTAASLAPGARSSLLPPEPWSGNEVHLRPAQPPRRLMVVARFGDDLTTDDVVAWGPRALLLDPGALAQRALAGRDTGLAARMAEAGGSCIVARREALAGPRCEIAAWVLARAGVRVVAAQSFAPGASRHLAAAGVLALEWPRDGRCQLEPGDEIELAGGPETRGRGAFVTVRNLARGSQELHRHDLDARWAAVLHAGGLIRHVSTMELSRE
jgi:aconitate hydratase